MMNNKQEMLKNLWQSWLCQDRRIYHLRTSFYKNWNPQDENSVYPGKLFRWPQPGQPHTNNSIDLHRLAAYALKGKSAELAQQLMSECETLLSDDVNCVLLRKNPKFHLCSQE